SLSWDRLVMGTRRIEFAFRRLTRRRHAAKPMPQFAEQRQGRRPSLLSRTTQPRPSSTLIPTLRIASAVVPGDEQVKLIAATRYIRRPLANREDAADGAPIVADSRPVGARVPPRRIDATVVARDEQVQVVRRPRNRETAALIGRNPPMGRQLSLTPVQSAPAYPDESHDCAHFPQRLDLELTDRAWSIGGAQVIVGCKRAGEQQHQPLVASGLKR